MLQLQFVWVLLLNGSKTGSTIIPADATSVTDLENLVDQAVAILGGKIDCFTLYWNVCKCQKGNHYTNQITVYRKGWNVSAVSFHKVMQVLYKRRHE
jgi:enoyl-[acyl-carrier protein] reductase I